MRAHEVHSKDTATYSLLQDRHKGMLLPGKPSARSLPRGRLMLNNINFKINLILSNRMCQGARGNKKDSKRRGLPKKPRKHHSCCFLAVANAYIQIVQRFVVFPMITSFIPQFKHFKAEMSCCPKYDRSSFGTVVLCSQVLKLHLDFFRTIAGVTFFLTDVCSCIRQQQNILQLLILSLHFSLHSLHLCVCLVSDPNALGQHGPDHALIGGVVAVVVFITLCLIIVLGRYLARHKGKRGHFEPP